MGFAVRLVLVAVAFSSLGCASSPPLSRHAEVVYPSPSQEVCTPGDTRPPAMSVTVRDDAAAALPGVHLFLATTSGTPAVQSAQTDGVGKATLTAPTGGTYVLTAALLGFKPTVNAFTLRSGCAGQADLTLTVGPLVIER